MTLPDKLSEAGKQQLARQIDFFHALTTRAFDHAERIVALNLEATRATLEQTSGAVRQLAAARDPRDLAALGTQSQQQMAAVMAYSRKLLEITNKPATPAAAPAPEAQIVTAEPVMVSEPTAESVPEPVAELAPEPVVEAVPAPTEPAAAATPAEPAASPVAASQHPMGEADPEPAPVMVGTPTAIAQAVSEMAAASADTPHPAASPVPDAGPVVIPASAPIDAAVEPASAPPPNRSRGPKKR